MNTLLQDRTVQDLDQEIQRLLRYKEELANQIRQNEVIQALKSLAHVHQGGLMTARLTVLEKRLGEELSKQVRRTDVIDDILTDIVDEIELSVPKAKAL